jgi:DNA-binding LacI/PurR family transcriptional regulator/DNA-binding transcriptional regulator YhcF (GntR family)
MNAIERAHQTIKARLADGIWSTGQRLPSIEQLSRLCAVSRTTMWKALALLQEESLVSTRRGGSIIAGVPSDKDHDQESGGYAWERLKIRIGREILQGAFFSGALPPVNKLALRYGVAIDTAKKALISLANDGQLVREGRQFRCAAKAAHRYRPAIVLLADEQQGGGMFLYDMRTNQVVESLERECVRLGYAPRFEGFRDTDPRGLLELKARLKAADAPIGFIVNMWPSWNETLRNRWIDLLAYLVSRKAPVIVLDQAGDLEFPDNMKEATNFRVLRISGLRAGEIVGDTLMRQGHRTVAYVTAYYKTSWARSRYRGLRRYYEQYGRAGSGVELHARGEVSDQNDLILSLLDLSEKEIRGVYAGRLSDSDLRNLHTRLKRLRGIVSSQERVRSSIARTLRPMARVVADLAHLEYDASIFEGMQALVLHLADSSAQELYLQPLFKEILKKSRATAWVCSDDKTGMDALTFLKARSIRVPDDVSIVCFENYRGAVKNQLTAYDFNMNGMIQEAMMMIMDERHLKNRPAISEIDGYVVERRTTRR